MWGKKKTNAYGEVLQDWFGGLFKSRTEDDLTVKQMVWPVAPRQEPEEVSCSVCKHRILKSDAKTVEEPDYVNTPFSYLHATGDILTKTNYYCPEHKPPYDEIGGCELSGELHFHRDHKKCEGIKYYQHIPATKREVTKEGKPVKK